MAFYKCSGGSEGGGASIVPEGYCLLFVEQNAEVQTNSNLQNSNTGFVTWVDGAFRSFVLDSKTTPFNEVRLKTNSDVTGIYFRVQKVKNGELSKVEYTYVNTPNSTTSINFATAKADSDYIIVTITSNGRNGIGYYFRS